MGASFPAEDESQEQQAAAAAVEGAARTNAGDLRTFKDVRIPRVCRVYC
jgi:hypothetical protein